MNGVLKFYFTENVLGNRKTHYKPDFFLNNYTNEVIGALARSLSPV